MSTNQAEESAKDSSSNHRGSENEGLTAAHAKRGAAETAQPKNRHIRFPSEDFEYQDSSLMAKAEANDGPRGGGGDGNGDNKIHVNKPDGTLEGHNGDDAENGSNMNEDPSAFYPKDHFEKLKGTATSSPHAVSKDNDGVLDGDSVNGATPDKKPRSKRKHFKNKKKHILDDDDSSSSASNSHMQGSFSPQQDLDEDGTHMEVSVAQLKRQVLGRNLRGSYHENENEDDGYDEEQEVAAAAAAADKRRFQSDKNGNGNVIASLLQKDLTCSICHEVFHEPVTISCGHSFCRDCLLWWLGHLKDKADADRENNNSADSPESSKKVNCPTCRQPLPPYLTEREEQLRVNTALRACVVALFAKELQVRIQTKRQATKGERDGAHSRGYQVLQALESGLVEKAAVTATNSGEHSSIFVKIQRSIVLDAQDQRMQLSLALDGPPKVLATTTTRAGDDSDDNNDENDVKSLSLESLRLVILCMEEDEAAEEGFPLVIGDTASNNNNNNNRTSADDEVLICSNQDRFRQTSIQVLARRRQEGRRQQSRRREEEGSDNNNDDDNQDLVPLDKLSFAKSGDGAVEYAVDALSLSPYTHLLFRHEESRAELEVDLQLRSKKKDKEADRKRTKSSASRRQPTGVLDDRDEESDGENLNEYQEDDGFLVGDHDEEEAVDEDDDCCVICGEGGEVMVCDGGDNLADCCGRSFHFACVGRDVLPEGDWICQDCAKSKLGLKVGIEGHEFPPEQHEGGGGSADEEEEARIPRKRKRVISVRDSSDDEETDHKGKASLDQAAENDLKDEESDSEAGIPKRKRVLAVNDSSDEDEGAHTGNEGEKEPLTDAHRDVVSDKQEHEASKDSPTKRTKRLFIDDDSDDE